MATLTDAARIAVWKEYGEEISAVRESVGSLTKAQLKAAIDAIDAWADANAASFNSAIPQPARGALTAKQKARLLMLVVARRHGETA